MEMSDAMKNLRTIAENIGVSLLPPGLSGFVTALQAMNSEEELKGKLAEVKEYAKNLQKQIPTTPTISIEIELVSAMILYFNTELCKEEIDSLETDLKELEQTDGLGIIEYYVETNYLVLNLDMPTDKDDTKEALNAVKELLNDYNTKVKAVAYL